MASFRGGREGVAAALVFLLILCSTIVANWPFLSATRVFVLSAFFLDAILAFLVLVFLRARWRARGGPSLSDGALMLMAVGVAVLALALTAWLAWRPAPPAPLPEAPPAYR